jgi:hypothetical protein
MPGNEGPKQSDRPWNITEADTKAEYPVEPPIFVPPWQPLPRKGDRSPGTKKS